MKLAILYPWLTTYGGVERVILQLARNFDSTIFTGFYEPEKTYEAFRELRISEYGSLIRLGKLQNYEGGLRSILLKLEDFDVVNPHMFPNTLVSHRYGDRTVWYCHAPIRAAYDLEKYYLEDLGPIGSLVFRVHHAVLRAMGGYAVKRISQIVCNSRETSRRVWRFYGRKAKIVHPGVDIRKYRNEGFENFLLMVGGLSRATAGHSKKGEFFKRPELAVEAMKFLPNHRLFVVGEGSRKEELMRNSPSNVKFLGGLDEETLIDLYARCLAVIFPSWREDFGLVPVEAMASGKPVIACRDGGGVRETVLDDETGFLVEPTPQAIAGAVKRLNNPHSLKDMSEKCQERSFLFSQERFVEKMREVFETL